MPQRPPLTQWLKVYCSLSQFRTSLPSVTVHDFTEQGRRAQWALAEYEADLRTLLKRAVGIVWNPKLDRLTIKGIGKLRRVHASEIFSDCDCGPILQTKDYDEPARHCGYIRITTRLQFPISCRRKTTSSRLQREKTSSPILTGACRCSRQARIICWPSTARRYFFSRWHGETRYRALTPPKNQVHRNQHFAFGSSPLEP